MPLYEASGFTFGFGDAVGIPLVTQVVEAEATFEGTSELSAFAQAHTVGESSFSGFSNFAIANPVLVSGTTTGAGNGVATPRLVARPTGDAVGAGDSSLGSGQVGHFVLANLEGAADISATSNRFLIFSGLAAGAGDLETNQPESAMGTTTGAGSLTGYLAHTVSVFGFTSGSGDVALSLPEPMIGFGNLVGFALILTVPPPVCGPICGCDNCCGRREEVCPLCEGWHRDRFHFEPWWWQCRECWGRHAWHQRENPDHHHHGRGFTNEPNPHGLIPPFRWNQTFGKGDLEICLKDRFGNQRGPVFIGYTMYTVSSTGILHQVGPTDRKPAQADVGKFYVTGTAGENGQPGCWAVKWRYQMTYSVPIQESIVQFRVLDAVLDCDRPDHLRRHCKYGWDV